jgi:hypothetical protein
MLSNTRYTNDRPDQSRQTRQLSTTQAATTAGNKARGLIQPGSVTHGLRMTTPVHANGVLPGQRSTGR